jgi:hypothetical protein
VVSCHVYGGSCFCICMDDVTVHLSCNYLQRRAKPPEGSQGRRSLQPFSAVIKEKRLGIARVDARHLNL